MSRPLALFLPALAVLSLAGCGRPSGVQKPVDTRAPATVRTAAVEAVSATRMQSVTATVRPVERASLSARIMGKVSRLHAPIGASVKAGEPVVTLEAGEVEARLQQARALLAQVERDLARETTLVKQGASSAEVALTLADRRRAAEAAVKEAETLASYTLLVAPFDGMITGRHVEIGDLAVPGAPLVELEGLTRLRAEAQVPESLPVLKIGDSIPVRIEDEIVEGRIAELSPSAAPVSRTRLAKIELPSSATARSGQFVRVLWPAGEHHFLRAPASAVTRFGQMERVWVVEDGRARLRLVRTGSIQADRIELLSGVVAGEVLIVDPSASLRDAHPVEIVR